MTIPQENLAGFIQSIQNLPLFLNDDVSKIAHIIKQGMASKEGQAIVGEYFRENMLSDSPLY